MVRRLFFGVAMLTLLTGAAQFPRVRPIRPRGPAVQPVPGWPKYCGNISMSGMPTGSSPINASTVTRLSLAWKSPVKGPIGSAPSVYRDIAYIGDWHGYETAI